MLALVVTVLFFAVIFVVAFLSVLVSAGVMEKRSAVAAGSNAAVLEDDGASGIIREDKVSSISPFAAVLQTFDFARLLKIKTAQAGLDWPVGRTVAMMLLCGTLSLAILSTDWMPLMLSIGLSAVAAFLPYFYIVRTRRKRFEQFEAQFPEAVDSLCRALKAGHPFAAGMEVVANEPYQPVSGEMRQALDEWKLGMTWGQALENLAVRVPISDVQIFVSAVKLHTRTGGRLGEVLGRVAEGMRENTSIRGEIRALATHGRMTGIILTVLPIVLGCILMLVNPHQMMLLFQDPLGQMMIVSAAVCLVLAHLVIKRIVNIRL